MSDYRAIGGASATLQTLLADRMEQPFGAAVPVTIGTPPFSTRDSDQRAEDARVNLFLYRVTENGYLQNQEIPGRGGAGGYGHPPLSLNLHYLLTAYGTTEVRVGLSTLFDDSTAQFVLGSAMRVLHDVPVITDSVTTQRAPSGGLVLHQSLRDEFEHVKISLEPLTLEDISKVWTALALRYRLSAAYVVNVVQIESRRARRFPRPVGQPASPTVPPFPSDAPSPGPMVYVLTIQTPTITDVRVIRAGTTTEQPFAYAGIGDDLVLRGTSLSGPITTVMFGEVEVPVKSAEPTRVVATIPDATVIGVGPIAPEQQLQPGVRTVKVAVRDPLVPQSRFTSSDAAFMLAPSVNLGGVTVASAPRRLIIDGQRLIGPTPGGETVIGRAVVPRAAYLAATPKQIVVPLPDTLPTRGVNAVVGSALPDPIALGAGAQALDVTIGGTTKTVLGNLPATVVRSTIAGVLGGLIRDADPTDPRFSGARVDVWNDALLIIPGGLTDAIAIAPSGGSSFAATLGLTGAPPPGATSALLSGVLASPPVLSAAIPQLRITIGAQPPLPLTLSKPTTLAALATDLQAKINAGAAAEYASARVLVSGSQLLVIPGVAGAVLFEPVAGDDTTVAELQLHARFAVRVRVNGAESIDPAVAELPL
ncbi:MAG TPA: DUF4255 domain-containing protein [Gemmatimonadaceae bacterium]